MELVRIVFDWPAIEMELFGCTQSERRSSSSLLLPEYHVSQMVSNRNDFQRGEPVRSGAFVREAHAAEDHG